MARVLVTGSAGFIGAHLVMRLLNEFSNPVLTKSTIVGVDNLNDYYDVELKQYRLKKLEEKSNVAKVDYEFREGDISDSEFVNKIFSELQPTVVVNLAAQAGVRYSLDNPGAYIQSNIVGFHNILEACRFHPVEHLVFASSSSVYGGNQKIPFSETDNVDNPVSLYAATKKSNELMAYAYSKLYSIPCTGLRFFTVYGPAGRPDMAYYSFTERMIEGKKIMLYGYGLCKRDFTYIDDIVEGIWRVMNYPPRLTQERFSRNEPLYDIYNIGGGEPIEILEFVKILKRELARNSLLPKDYKLSSHVSYLPMQPGDVTRTFADSSKIEKTFGFKPHTNIRDGIKKFVEWYKLYKKLQQASQ